MIHVIFNLILNKLSQVISTDCVAAVCKIVMNQKQGSQLVERTSDMDKMKKEEI
jgi:hypothetical protein